MSILRAGLVALLAVTVSACGTTVTGGSAGGSAPGGDGLSAGGYAPAGSATTRAGGAAAGSLPGSGGPGSTPGAAVGPSAQATLAAGGGLGAAGGRTLPPIQIGTYYLNGGNAALAAAGFGGLVIPDNKPVFEAFVKYINAHGGLGGRQVQPVYYEYNEGQDPQAQDAAACATFTQDHHVFLVIGGINSGAGELLPCLAKHDVPLIGAATQGDQRFFEQYRRYAYEPDELNLTTGLKLLIANLKARGYLASVHKVGLVQYPGAIYDNAVRDGLIPALKSVGLSLTDRVVASSTTDNSAIASAATNAELRFSSEHIDLVVFATPGGAAETYFMSNAQTQGYKPKYGIWSADSPYVLAKTAPSGQLAGSIGVGYLPGLDVASNQDPTAGTAAGKACLAMGKSMGLDESGLGNALVRTSCDVFFTLQKAMASAVAATTSTAALEQAIDAIGSSYAPASTFAIRWNPAHHDAAAGYRNLAYNTGCSCFTYVGATQRIP